MLQMVPVTVVPGGDLTASALIYKQPSYSTIEYLANNMRDVLGRVGGYATEFAHRVSSMFDKHNSDEVLLASKQIVAQTGLHFNQYSIHYIPETEIYNANLRMQEYIMVHPEVYRKHERNMCYGFQDTYVDPEPGTPLQDRVRYQQVMDGIVQFDKDGDGYTYHYSNTDEELDTIDQISILDTWDHVYKLLAEGRDPTDPNKDE